MNYLDINLSLPSVPLQFRSVQYAAPQAGTKLLVLGAVHGNETCGTRGILQMLAEFESGQRQLIAGQVTFVPVTNPKAFAQKTRNGDRNLNRNLQPTTPPREFEDSIANWLCPLMQQHDALLDLHSFHTGGQPFAMVGPRNNDGNLEPFALAAQEEAMALRLGVTRFVDGWLDTYARGVERRMREHRGSNQRNHILSTDPSYGIGTTEYMRSQGGLAITLECGQHDDAQSPLVAYQAIENTLAHFGLVAAAPPPAVAQREMLSLYEVVDKIDAGDSFVKTWRSFDAVEAGQLIGTRANGQPVHAEQAGHIVFPNPAATASNEWFYLAQKTDRLERL
jgi:uncharacterized protein